MAVLLLIRRKSWKIWNRPWIRGDITKILYFYERNYLLRRKFLCMINTIDWMSNPKQEERK